MTRKAAQTNQDVLANPRPQPSAPVSLILSVAAMLHLIAPSCNPTRNIYWMIHPHRVPCLSASATTLDFTSVSALGRARRWHVTSIPAGQRDSASVLPFSSTLPDRISFTSDASAGTGVCVSVSFGHSAITMSLTACTVVLVGIVKGPAQKKTQEGISRRDAFVVRGRRTERSAEAF